MIVLAVAFVAVSALLALPLWQKAEAGDSGNGCKLQGSWLGRLPTGETYIVTYHGTGANEGTDDLEWITGSPTFFGMFPNATSASANRGVWAKTGPNKFDFTLLQVGLNANQQVEYIAQYSGTKILTDCNTMEVRTTAIEILSPADLQPLVCIPMDPSAPPTIAHRIALRGTCP
jgi:hypothetical protein